MNKTLFLISVLIFLFGYGLSAQKVLQIEKFGDPKTRKIFPGESVFIQTEQNPDFWFEAVIEDLLPDAQAIVFYDRIITIKDIKAIKFRKKSAAHGMGKALQVSWLVPAAYEMIYGSINPPVDWKSLAYIGGGAIVLGALLRLIPPKKYKMGKKRRLRVLDLTFYPD